MGLFRRRRRRRRRGFFSRVSRAFRRIGRGIKKTLRRHGGKILGAAFGPLGLVGGALYDRKRKKDRNRRRQAEAQRRGRLTGRKKTLNASTMPKPISGKDFIGTGMGENPANMWDYHWNPRDGWIKDLNGDGIIDIDDFKLAKYPEHKKYIRDWILSHQFDRNKYLDPNQDGVVDIDDYELAEDITQKLEIKKYVEDRGGSLTGQKINNLVIHMVNEDEKGYIFEAQDEVENGLKGNVSGAIIRNITINNIYEYHEAVQKFGTDVGRPMIRGVKWEGDDDENSLKQAVKILQTKLPDRFSKFFHSNGIERRLRGLRGTIFRVIKREDSNTVDVKEIQPNVNENAFTIDISGDFEPGPSGDVFSAHEELVGIGNLEGRVRTGVVKRKTKSDIVKKLKRKSKRGARIRRNVKQNRRENVNRRKRRGGFLSKLRSGEISFKPSRKRGRRLAGKARTRGRWGNSRRGVKVNGLRKVRLGNVLRNRSRRRVRRSSSRRRFGRRR